MKKWWFYCVVTLIAFFIASTASEAGQRVRCRTKCKMTYTTVCGTTTVKSEVKTEVKCTGSSCKATATSTEQSGWQFAAEQEARTGAPAQHAFSASQIASMAGYPGASIFVGVGYGGQTCTTCRGTLVAEAHNGSKSVRIWLR